MGSRSETVTSSPEERVREQLTGRLRGKLSEHEWVILVHQEYVEEAISGAYEIDYLAETVRTWRQTARENERQTLPKRTARSAPAASALEKARRDAVAALLARAASDDGEVRRFRAEVLGDRTIRRSEVSSWMETYAAAEAPPTLLAEVELLEPQLVLTPVEMQAIGGDDGDDYRPPDGVTRARVRTRRIFKTWIDYPLSGGWVGRRAVRVGATLDRLRLLCDRLQQNYRWEQADAVAFVLSEAEPPYSALKISVSTQDSPFGLDADGSFFRLRSPAVAATRVTIDADPALDAATFERTYNDARRKALGGRVRRLELPTLQLAAFSARHSDLTWSACMIAWNRKNPNRRYGDVKQFASTARRAQAKILRERQSPA